MTDFKQASRARSEGLEACLDKDFAVLDHGFVRVVDYMGNDHAITQAARVSYGSGTESRRDNSGLIRYLMRHRHSTPFEMCEIKLHVKLPIFVARQWIRHRTANVNEYSARYSVLDSEFYLPDLQQMASQSTHNAQGREERLSEGEAQQALDLLKQDSEHSFASYQQLLAGSDGKGLARELARITLPVSVYTQWYWKIDLHNLLHFLELRSDSHAQHEIQAYARVICDLVKVWVPETWKAFEEYRLHAKLFSATEMQVLHRMLAGESPSQSDSGLSVREWNEFHQSLDGTGAGKLTDSVRNS